jgi:hypothetical protein
MPLIANAIRGFSAMLPEKAADSYQCGIVFCGSFCYDNKNTDAQRNGALKIRR